MSTIWQADTPLQEATTVTSFPSLPPPHMVLWQILLEFECGHRYCPPCFGHSFWFGSCRL